MNKDSTFEILLTKVKENAVKFRQIYTLEKKLDISERHGASEEFKGSLNNLINSLIYLGESYPGELVADNLEESILFSENPIFIGGVHKSGTTLIRNLLDGHNKLAVLPLDGPGVLFFEKSIKDGVTKCHHKILRQILLIFISHPSGLSEVGDWVLSGGEYRITSYITFVRNYFAWISKFGCSIKGIFQSLAVAYRETVYPEDLLKKTSWVHKCTLNVEDADELSSLFPNAKFLHIIRHPCAVYASQRSKEPLVKRRDCNPNYELECLHRGLRYGMHNLKKIGLNRYNIVKYEDLVRNNESSMEIVASFLGIDYEDVLVKPSVMSIIVKSNTAYSEVMNKAGLVNTVSLNAWKKRLTKDEINVLVADLRDFFHFYGYNEREIHISKFLFSLLRVEWKYLREKGVKMLNLHIISHMVIRSFMERIDKRRAGI